MVRTLLILLFSFLASFGFGVTFQIRGIRSLALAGLGGLLTRSVYLLLSALFPDRFVCVMIASFAASGYGELMARRKHVPASYFIYPSIIPLIPGDLFHYAIASVLSGNMALAKSQAGDCVIVLLALCLGMMISSTTIQSIRKGPVSDD